jgi:hypothetical protein
VSSCDLVTGMNDVGYERLSKRIEWENSAARNSHSVGSGRRDDAASETVRRLRRYVDQPRAAPGAG